MNSVYDADIILKVRAPDNLNLYKENQTLVLFLIIQDIFHMASLK